MNLIFADEGLEILLARLATPSVQVHLFTNNITPTRNTVLDDLDLAVFTGYAAVTVLLADFVLSGVTAHTGFLIAAPVAFLNSSGAPVSCYGYAVTEVGGAELLAAARFDAAPISKADGESFLVTPILGDFSQFAA